MASGFINMLSYWFFFIATVVLMSSIYVEGGPASSGWTIYPPLSALPEAIPGSGTGMTLWLLSITLFVVGSLLGGLNYIVTILNLRTKGMSMQRMPRSLGIFSDCNIRSPFIPCSYFHVVCCYFLIDLLVLVFIFQISLLMEKPYICRRKSYII